MAAVAAVLAGTGLVVSGAAAAAGGQTVRPSLEYGCPLPSGWQRVSVQVAMSIPETVTAGQRIQPVAPGITVTIPRTDIGHLAKLNASTVSATAQFRMGITEDGSRVADPWLVQATTGPVLSHSDLVLHVPAAVPAVTAPGMGSITFAATGLSVLIAPHSAGGSAVMQLAPMPLTCALNPGQSATLATVPVTAVARHTAGSPAVSGGTLWEVSPGGSFSASASQTKLADTATGMAVTCTSSALTGTLKKNRELPGAGIASFTAITFSKCSAPGKKTFTVVTSASASHPWLMNAQSYDPATAVTTVTVSGIMASISGPGCSATVAGPASTAPGTVDGSYANSLFSSTLGISPPGGTTHVWKVSGCSGLFKNADPLTVTTSYSITPLQFVVPAFCPPFPIKTGFPFNRHFKFPPYPPGSHVSPPGPPSQGCAYIKGFSDVQKLHETALIGPGLGNLQISRRTINKPPKGKFPGYFQSDSSGQLYYKPCPGSTPQCKAINGLPPATATLLSFGFVPTTATLQITQVGNLDIAVVGTESTLKYTKIMSMASIRITKVLVNGVPLNIGSDCHTITPFRLVLFGRPPYTLQTGGRLTGTIDVPEFTGCGSGENLDTIFDASVSGPQNFVQLTQGNLCTDWPIPPPPPGCPATVPKPIH